MRITKNLNLFSFEMGKKNMAGVGKKQADFGRSNWSDGPFHSYIAVEKYNY